jgi:hypothetical protein
MVERFRVVAQHVAIANAQPAVVRDDDPARFERFDRGVHRLRPAGDAEVGAAGREGRIAAATSAVGSTLYSLPTVFISVCARSSTARREFGSTPSTAIGVPKVTNARDL